MQLVVFFEINQEKFVARHLYKENVKYSVYMFVKLNAPCQITSIDYLAVGIPGYEWLAVFI